LDPEPEVRSLDRFLYRKRKLERRQKRKLARARWKARKYIPAMSPTTILTPPATNKFEESVKIEPEAPDVDEYQPSINEGRRKPKPTITDVGEFQQFVLPGEVKKVNSIVEETLDRFDDVGVGDVGVGDDNVDVVVAKAPVVVEGVSSDTDQVTML
jgi:hypothetical protein